MKTFWLEQCTALVNVGSSLRSSHLLYLSRSTEQRTALLKGSYAYLHGLDESGQSYFGQAKLPV